MSLENYETDMSQMSNPREKLLLLLMTSFARVRTRRLYFLLMVSLGLTNVFSLIWMNRHQSISGEESRTLAAGAYLWRTGTFRFGNDIPPLTRLWVGLSAIGFGTTVEDVQALEACPDMDSQRRFEDHLTRNFVAYAKADNVHGMVITALLVNFLWWLLGAWFVERWSRDLFGTAGSGLTLSLWTTGPNILAAEATLGRSLSAAVLTFAATYSFWLYQKSPSWLRAFRTGLVLGFCLLVDYALIVLPAILAILWVIDWLGRSSTDRFPVSIGHIVLLIFASLWVVNLGYGPQTEWQSLEDWYHFVQGPNDPKTPELVDTKPVANRFHGTWLGSTLVPVPTHYLVGLERWWKKLHSRNRYGSEPQHYPVTQEEWLKATLSRVPLGTWVLVAWGTILTIGGPPRLRLAELAALWITAGAFLAVSATYQWFLPLSEILVLCAPFMIVGVGSLASVLVSGRRLPTSLLLLTLIGSVSSSLVSVCKGQPYLNEMVGGSSNPSAQRRFGPGDGGRELPLLKAWLDQHPNARPLGLAVRHILDPRFFGIAASEVPISSAVAHEDSTEIRPVGPLPGYYALDFASLRCQKYEYFHAFRPISQVGSSIFVYQITPEDATRVRSTLGLSSLNQGAKSSRVKGRWILHRTETDDQVNWWRYSLFLPSGYKGDRPYPLIVFLHGVGDAGSDGDQYLRVGLPPQVKAMEDSFPFLALFPQGRDGNWNIDSEDTKHGLAILDRVQSEFNVDQERLYLTGVSSGGAGTWDWATRFPERWAAIVPISSGGCDEKTAPKIVSIPCWCFHNADDSMSPPTSPRGMIAALKRAGGVPRYTEFFSSNNNKHDAWTQAYNSSRLYEWLASQQILSRPSASHQ